MFITKEKEKEQRNCISDKKAKLKQGVYFQQTGVNPGHITHHTVKKKQKKQRNIQCLTSSLRLSLLSRSETRCSKSEMSVALAAEPAVEFESYNTTETVIKE